MSVNGTVKQEGKTCCDLVKKSLPPEDMHLGWVEPLDFPRTTGATAQGQVPHQGTFARTDLRPSLKCFFAEHKILPTPSGPTSGSHTPSPGHPSLKFTVLTEEIQQLV